MKKNVLFENFLLDKIPRYNNFHIFPHGQDSNQCIFPTVLLDLPLNMTKISGCSSFSIQILSHFV